MKTNKRYPLTKINNSNNWLLKRVPQLFFKFFSVEHFEKYCTMLYAFV